MSSLENKKEEHFSYSPFGYNYRNTTEQPIGFQNMWTDEDELIVAENGRTYAPWIGRFLQRDPESPFGESGIDSYVFAENSPVMAGDPTGFMVRLWQWFRQLRLPTATTSMSASFAARSATASVAESIGIARTMKIPNIVPGALTDVRAITGEMLAAKGGKCAHLVVLESAKRFAPAGYKVNVEAFAKFPDDRVSSLSGGLSRTELNRLWKAYGPRGHSLTEIQHIQNTGMVDSRFFQRPMEAHIGKQLRFANAKAGIMLGSRRYAWEGANKGFSGGSHAVLFGEQRVEGAMARGPPKLQMWADVINERMNRYFGPVHTGSRLFEKYRIFGVIEDIN